MTKIDKSGRTTHAWIRRALGWSSGHERAVFLHADPHGAIMSAAQGAFTGPARLRARRGITAGHTVPLAAAQTSTR